jgi:hypothetical protein
VEHRQGKAVYVPVESATKSHSQRRPPSSGFRRSSREALPLSFFDRQTAGKCGTARYWCCLASTGVLCLLILGFPLPSLAHSGFLPTSIFTAVDVPVSTPTNLPVFSEGETFKASTRFKTTAARICSGSWSSRRPFKDSIPFGVSTATPIPIDTLSSTPKSLSPWILNCAMPIRRGGPLTLFHPADFNSSSMSETRVKHSSSAQVPTNAYSIPSNVLSGAAIVAERGSLLGVVSRSSLAVRMFALFVASAKCDSASAACFLADLISASNESASSRAPFASVKAFDDATSAFLASVSALPRDSSAFPALVSASFDWDNAIPESVNAVDALLAAVRALTSRELIICADKKSFLCPYGYATISANTATPKKHRAISSRILSFFSSRFAKWANTSKRTSNAKHTSAVASRTLWTRLTESSEFQSGISVIKSIAFASILVGSFVLRLLRYKEKWRGQQSSAKCLCK